ncbi:hypothetical protein Tco_0265733 [Tanacetum coccineum]
MLAPNLSSSYNGRPSFVNPKYLKKAQSEKPCLYKMPYEKDDLANIFDPNCDETFIFEEESRSKQDKELIKKWQQPITHEITMLVKKLLIPLAIKTKANANEFERVIKQEMFEDLQYGQSLEKEVDELEFEKEEAMKKAQIQKDNAFNTKPSVQNPARLPNTTNGSKPKPRNSYQQPRNWPPAISSRVSNKAVNIAEPPRNSIPFLNSKNLACPTCKKCIYSANHDVLQWLPKPISSKGFTNIVVLTMITRNAGRRTISTRGVRTSEQDGREGERTGDQARSGRGGQGSGRGSQGGSRGGQGSGQGRKGGCRGGQESDHGSQGSSRGNGANRGGGGVPDFATIIAQQLQNLLPTIVAQVGNHVNNRGNNENQDDNVINNNNQGNVRTVNMNNGQGSCSYKEFMAYNPKDYDGKGGAIVYTCWIEKMESFQNISG